MFQTCDLVITMDLLNVMAIITYRPIYCIFALKFCTFGIPSRKFLALPLHPAHVFRLPTRARGPSAACCSWWLRKVRPVAQCATFDRVLNIRDTFEGR